VNNDDFDKGEDEEIITIVRTTKMALLCYFYALNMTTVY